MKFLGILGALAVVIIAARTSARADTVTVDFEAQGVGAPTGVTFARPLVINVSGNTVFLSGGELITGNPFFGNDSTAIYATASVCIDCSLDIQIGFLVPVSNVSLLLLTPLSPSPTQYTLTDNNGDGTGAVAFGQTPLSLPFGNISGLNLAAPLVLTNGAPSWAFAIDDLTFTTPTTVPEPASLLLVASGLGLLLSRSRKKIDKHTL